MKYTTVTTATLLLLGLLSMDPANASVIPRTERELLSKRKKASSLMERKDSFWRNNQHMIKRNPSVRNAPQVCTNGKVSFGGEDFSCENVDFTSFVGLPELEIVRPDFDDEILEAADIWGWVSPTSGKEFTIICLQNGVRFIDGTNPLDPINYGYMPSVRLEDTWCDVKVYKDTLYVVKDGQTQNFKGIQVFDLKRLEQTGPGADNKYEHDFLYTKHGNSHNLIIDNESGFMYSVGTGADACNTGLHAIDLADPLRPKFAGCAGQDGYIHDAQCMKYAGPDTRYSGKQICIGFDVDAVTIFNVEDKANIEIISTVRYDGSQYCHQGWVTSEWTHLLMDDELDEQDGGLVKTRTYVFDITDLENPFRTGHYDHPNPAIDHNLYVWGTIHKNGWAGNGPVSGMSEKYMYNSNYVAGLRVVDIQYATRNPPVLREVGHFDVSPDLDEIIFFGAWSTYMHPSGNMAISVIDRGLFFVKPNMVFTDPEPFEITEPPVVPPPTTTTAPAPTTGGESSESDDEGSLLSSEATALLVGVVAIFAVLGFLSIGAILLFTRPATGNSSTKEEAVEAKQEITGTKNPVADTL